MVLKAVEFTGLNEKNHKESPVETVQVFEIYTDVEFIYANKSPRLLCEERSALKISAQSHCQKK